MKKWSLFLFFILIFNCGFPQHSLIDSLSKLCDASKDDTSKIRSLNFLARAYIDMSVYDSGAIIAKQSEELCISALKQSKSDKTTDALKRRLVDIYANFGIIAEMSDNTTEALKYYNKALNLSKEIKNKRGIADAYTFIGIVHDTQGNMSESIKDYFTALRYYEEIGDKGGIASAYNNIAYVYCEQDNFEQALKYDLLSLKIDKERNNKAGIANSYLSIGIVYQNLQKFNEALQMYNDALPIMRELENKEGIANIYNSIGVVFANRGLENKNAQEKKKDLQQALQAHLEALKLRKEIDNTAGICASLINLGYVNTKLNNYTEAKKYLDEGIKLGTEIASRYTLKHGYFYRSELDSAMGNFKASYTDYKLHVMYRDSLFNEETRKKTIQNQMSFDFEKKEAIAQAEHKLELQNQSKQAEQQSKKQKLIIAFVAAGLLLVAFFAVYVFRSLRITNKQKQIIEMQKQIVEEKHKEINDSINYAERIQRSFLATKKLLDDNLREYFIFFQPKDIVSGDFYWASTLPPFESLRTQGVSSGSKFILCTADSTGHGVPGAIMSILNISSLERAIEHGCTKPGDILNHARKTIIERLKKDGSEEGGKDGMDASLICFDFEKSKMQYASANNPIWVVRDKQLIELLPDKMPVGKHDKDQQSFTNNEFEIKANDMIYTLTDGLPDQFGGPKGKKFMYKKLKDLLISNSNDSLEVQKQKVVEAFENWKMGIEQIDDITLIGIKI